MTSSSPPLDRVVYCAPSLLDASALRQSLRAPPAWADPYILFDPSKLPPLLEIPDPKIASQAVRHKNKHLEGPNVDLKNPRRYEWDLDSYEVFEGLGDKYLGASVGRSLRKRYPGLTTGPLSVLSQKLVRNDTISYLSLAYGLLSRLEFNRARDQDQNQNVAADLFEAHIGGLMEYEDQEGIRVGIDEWLAKVFDDSVWPTLAYTAQELRARKLEQDQKYLEHKQKSTGSQVTRWTCSFCDLELDTVLPKPRFAFDDTDPNKGWHARMYIEGTLVSCGRARARKDAEIAASNNFVVGIRSRASNVDDGCS
ncbi:hypothetical protein JCM16303_006863 [Sporobolomyces ruberrimus]